MTRSPITTHVLDVMAGRPGVGIPVKLEQKAGPKDWVVVAEGVTDADGRISDLMPANDQLLVGDYRLVFDTSAYFAVINIDAFYTQITISFVVKDSAQHYHVPLLLSPFGYTTYRGS